VIKSLVFSGKEEGEGQERTVVVLHEGRVLCSCTVSAILVDSDVVRHGSAQRFRVASRSLPTVPIHWNNTAVAVGCIQLENEREWFVQVL
jgi:hypothetical protein